VRYQKINIKARTPKEVYPKGPKSAVSANIGFLKQCIKKIPTVNFIDEATGMTYASVNKGSFSVRDERILANQLQDDEQAQIFAELAPSLSRQAANRPVSQA